MNQENITPGKRTSEFYVTIITNIINLLLMILLSGGLITQEEADPISNAAAALLLAALPLGTAIVNKEYTKGRAAVKVGSLNAAGNITIQPVSTIEVSEWEPGADHTKEAASE